MKNAGVSLGTLLTIHPWKDVSVCSCNRYIFTLHRLIFNHCDRNFLKDDLCAGGNITCGENAKCCILDESTKLQGCRCDDGFVPKADPEIGCIGKKHSLVQIAAFDSFKLKRSLEISLGDSSMRTITVYIYNNYISIYYRTICILNK